MWGHVQTIYRFKPDPSQRLSKRPASFSLSLLSCRRIPGPAGRVAVPCGATQASQRTLPGIGACAPPRRLARVSGASRPTILYSALWRGGSLLVPPQRRHELQLKRRSMTPKMPSCGSGGVLAPAAAARASMSVEPSSMSQGTTCSACDGARASSRIVSKATKVSVRCFV